ncbi:MAG: CocE/NonD family hydrolase C-terminal non-catalytic domain-containing protein, partial [Boseongicola sp.]
DLEPGVPIHTTIDLDNCAYRLPSGHRMRVAVSTAYWPFIWPARIANGVSITAGEIHLPVLEDVSKTIDFPPPESAPAWRATELRAAKMTRETEVRPDGKRVIKIVTDNGEMRDQNHGLATGSMCYEEWSIHPDDPLSAKGSFDWVETLSRGDWSVHTHCTASLTSSNDNWHARARIEAFEGETLIYSKDFTKDIPRDGI